MPDLLEQPPAETTEVTAAPGEGATVTKEPDKPTISAADLRKLNQRVEDLETQVHQANEAAMHWHDQYKAATDGKSKEPAPATGDEEPSEDDLIDVITAQGTKGLLKTLRRHGVMTEDEVERRVEAKLRGARNEQTIRERYPDLEDQDSEMFKVTARHYKALESEGVEGPARVSLAAERAELEMRRKGTWKDPEEAEERRSRARAQASGGNGRSAAPDPNDKTLTGAQKRYAELFEISEDAYRKRAEDGIRFSGLRR